MEQRVPAATQFSNTPLPAPILVHKGAQLKNDQLLSELALAPSDYLTFLYPVRHRWESTCFGATKSTNKGANTLSNSHSICGSSSTLSRLARRLLDNGNDKAALVPTPHP